MKKALFIVCVCFGLLLRCSSDSNSTLPFLEPASELPLLQGSNKIGTIVGFNPSNPTTTNDSIQARWDEALNAGMRIGRLQIDWTDLETAPNIYNKDVLETKLIEFNNQNLQTFLLISAYDSDGPEIPEDLEGLNFNDPVLINRFNQLMDWIIPMLIRYNGYIISITNEADNSFGEEPNLHHEILAFLQDVKPHIQSINSQIAVTVTMAEGSLDEDKPGIPAIIQACDVASWNFYGASFSSAHPYYIPQSTLQIQNDIQRMLDISGDKNIVIQELGMHNDETILNSSLEIQRQFFETFFQAMQNEERLKVAYIFQLVDWSPEASALVAAPLLDAGLPTDFIEAYTTSLETIGLIQYENGNKNPAWNTFISWLTTFN